jgi:hypothetical protein
MGMETMHLVQTPHAIDFNSLSDIDIEAFFASAGLPVEVVTHCSTPDCSTCFTEAVAEAA